MPTQDLLKRIFTIKPAIITVNPCIRVWVCWGLIYLVNGMGNSWVSWGLPIPIPAWTCRVQVHLGKGQVGQGYTKITWQYCTVNTYTIMSQFSASVSSSSSSSRSGKEVMDSTSLLETYPRRLQAPRHKSACVVCAERQLRTCERTSTRRPPKP